MASVLFSYPQYPCFLRKIPVKYSYFSRYILYDCKYITVNILISAFENHCLSLPVVVLIDFLCNLLSWVNSLRSIRNLPLNLTECPRSLLQFSQHVIAHNIRLLGHTVLVIEVYTSIVLVLRFNTPFQHLGWCCSSSFPCDKGSRKKYIFQWAVF